MAIAHVASDKGQPTTTAIDSTGANLLVGFDCFLTLSPVMSDSKSNTYTMLTQRNDVVSSFNICIGYNLGGTVGASHTFSDSNGNSRTQLYAFSGAAASSVLDAETGALSSGAVTSLGPGTLTPSVDGCLIVIMLEMGSTVVASADIPAGYTQLKNDALSVVAYKIQTTAAAETPVWTFSSQTAVAAMAVFKPAAGGGGGGAHKSRKLLLGVGA